MARIWPIQPDIPSPSLLALAERMVGEADRLMAMEITPGQGEVEALAQSIAIWSITVERMAATGPTYLAQMARRFEDHPEYGQPGDRLVHHRAMADLYAFVGLGDRVLDDLARAILTNRGRPPSTGAVAWNKLLDWADEAGTNVRAVHAIKRLHVGLRMARHRLVAHVRPDHAPLWEWDRDDSLRIHMLALPVSEPTWTAMRALGQQLVVPVELPNGMSASSGIEALAAAAPAMSAAQLHALDRIAREAGYASSPVRSVVDDVLRVAGGLIGP